MVPCNIRHTVNQQLFGGLKHQLIPGITDIRIGAVTAGGTGNGKKGIIDDIQLIVPIGTVHFQRITVIFHGALFIDTHIIKTDKLQYNMYHD